MKKTLLCLLGFAVAANLAACSEKKPASTTDKTTVASTVISEVTTSDTSATVSDVTTEIVEPPVSTDEPPVSTEKPPVTTDEPPVTTDEPPVSTDEPPVSTDEPPVSTDEPPVSTDEPPVSTDEPPVSTDEPPVSTDEPPVSTDEPPVIEVPPEFDILAADLSQYVVLGQYMGIEVFVSGLELVSDEELDRIIDNLVATLPKEAMITDRACALGDCVNIDYVGTLDGVPVSDGTDSDVRVVLGIGNLYPGFEEAIAGMVPGTTQKITLLFPEDYYEDLANKSVDFDVTLNYIYPTLTDELAVKYFDAESAEAYRQELRTLLDEQSNSENADAKNIAAWTAVLSRATVTEYPEALLISEKNSLVEHYASLAEAYGITYEALFTDMYGMTLEDADIMITEGAKIAAAEKLTLYAVAKDMGLDVASYTDDKTLYKDVVGRIVEGATFTTD